GRRDFGDQNVSVAHLLELVRSVNYPRDARDAPRTRADALDRVSGGLAGARGHPTGKVDSQEAAAAFDGQHHRRRDRALALPRRPPPGYCTAIILRGLRGIQGTRRLV